MRSQRDISFEESCVQGSGEPESEPSARIPGSLPDMVATTMCPQRVTLVNTRNIHWVGGFPLKSHVFRDEEHQNRHRLLDCWLCYPDIVVTSMFPERVTMVNITKYVVKGFVS